MTINDFIKLDDLSKEQAVSAAVCLTNQHVGSTKVLTYDFGDFRVEVVYNRKKIMRFRFFRTDLHVDYIGQIDMRSIGLR
jgi:hypothetical protein